MERSAAMDRSPGRRSKCPKARRRGTAPASSSPAPTPPPSTATWSGRKKSRKPRRRDRILADDGLLAIGSGRHDRTRHTADVLETRDVVARLDRELLERARAARRLLPPWQRL